MRLREKKSVHVNAMARLKSLKHVDMKHVQNGVLGLSGANAVEPVVKELRSAEEVVQDIQEIVQEMIRRKKSAKIDHALSGHNGENGHSAAQPVARAHVTV